jgi:hypothetical protein
VAKVPTLFGSVADDLGSSYATGLAPANVSDHLYSKYLWAIANIVGLGAPFVAELEANYPLSRHMNGNSRGGGGGGGGGGEGGRSSALYLTLLDIVGDSNLACTAHDTTLLLSSASSTSASTSSTDGAIIPATAAATPPHPAYARCLLGSRPPFFLLSSG